MDGPDVLVVGASGYVGQFVLHHLRTARSLALDRAASKTSNTGAVAGSAHAAPWVVRTEQRAKPAPFHIVGTFASR